MRGAVLVAVIAAGCVDISDEHRCAVSDDCPQGGRCELPAGNCSIADSTCGPGGFRYDDKSGERSGACVVFALSPVALPPIQFADQDDTVDTTCAPAGARDAFVELDSPLAQILFVMTDPAMSTTPVAMTIRDGACPGVNPISECVANPCPPTTIGMLLAQIPMGRSCLVVEAADAATAGQVALQLFPSQRLASPIGPGATMPGQTTCSGVSEPNMVCGNPAAIPSAAYVFPLCPGNYQFSVTVTPSAPLDPVIALRPSVPYFDDSGAPACQDAATGPSPETITNQAIGGPGVYWLLVEAADGGTCGSFDLSSFSIMPQ